ncbi:LysR family transcriptional regulator [Pseudomonas panipatensis]|uniref:DNA-binding transcriptional regulator, LysR family n=1 Tax=Pseudomonas panipatensis TaxID=428992 RepID=A0A1G8FRS5_9PSED|nr:LysR family transcriptional regulator [Pseudomonas panipatensis]SDH84824.1 DNA-binding transcriptional regulator, LysR family [Pseudomonas panipatensis]SMP52484.1 transcriptional regulator, LysR family [Pseudomonas panipatensis]
MDQLTALRVFRNVVEQGGFAAAARKLGLSPAAISKNIGELEAHLATRLLNRTTRRMSLTEAGRQYYQQLARILDDLDDADRSLGPLRDHLSGTLRVSAPMTFSLECLTRHIPVFLERHPQLALDLQLDDRRVDIVKEGFDLAIRGSDQLQDSSLVARHLTTLEHVICASPAYFQRHGQPHRPEDLQQHQCLRFSLSGHANTWTFGKNGKDVTVPVKGRYQVSSSLAIRDALRAGLGLSLVPLAYVREDLERGVLQSALDDWTKVRIQVHALYPSARYLNPKVRAFIDFLLEILGEPLTCGSAG